MTLEDLIKRADRIVRHVKQGDKSRKQGVAALRSLYDLAWMEEPNSEPDGDIEYTISTAVQEIEANRHER